MTPIECARNNIEPVSHDGSSILQKIREYEADAAAAAAIIAPEG